MEINITKEVLQAMIAHNKKQIRELENDRRHLQGILVGFWPFCDPVNSNNTSTKAYFILLNKTKDSVRDVQKKLKMLSTAQAALKRSIG